MGEQTSGQRPRRIVFKDADGKVSWFSTDQIELSWNDLAFSGTAGFGDYQNLALLCGNKWVMYDEPPPFDGGPAKVRFVSEQESLDWLLLRGHEPPACLTAVLNGRCVVKSSDKPNASLLHVLDTDDGGRSVVIDVSGAQSWGPRSADSGDYDPINFVPQWWYSDTLYRLASGRFVRIRGRSHCEVDLVFEPEVKRFSDEEAARWLLFEGFEPPTDIATLAAEHRFQDEMPVKPPAAQRTGNEPAIRWNKETCELSVNGEIVRKLRGRKVAKNVALVLDCFEDDGWPQRIDSPFAADETGTQTCRETIRSLNDGLRLIRFVADGSGEGIVWKPDPISTTSRASPEEPF